MLLTNFNLSSDQSNGPRGRRMDATSNSGVSN